MANKTLSRREFDMQMEKLRIQSRRSWAILTVFTAAVFSIWIVTKIEENSILISPIPWLLICMIFLIGWEVIQTEKKIVKLYGEISDAEYRGL